MVSLERKELTLHFCMPFLIIEMLQFHPVFHMNLHWKQNDSHRNLLEELIQVTSAHASSSYIWALRGRSLWFKMLMVRFCRKETRPNHQVSILALRSCWFYGMFPEDLFCFSFGWTSLCLIKTREIWKATVHIHHWVQAEADPCLTWCSSESIAKKNHLR